MKALLSLVIVFGSLAAQANTVGTRVLPADAKNIRITSLRLSEAPTGKKVESTEYDSDTGRWLPVLHNATEAVYAITVSYQSARDAHYENRFDQDVLTDTSEKTFNVSLASLAPYADMIKARPTKASTALANALFSTKVIERTSDETRKINRCYDNNDNEIPCTGEPKYVTETVTRKYLFLNQNEQ